MCPDVAAGTGIEENSERVLVTPIPCRQHQGGVSVGIRCLDVGAVRKQRDHKSGVPGSGIVKQGSVPMLSSEVHIRAMGHQLFGDVQIAEAAQQRRAPITIPSVWVGAPGEQQAHDRAALPVRRYP